MLIAKEAANEAKEIETDILNSIVGRCCLKFSTTAGKSRGVNDNRSFVGDLVVFPSEGNSSTRQ